MAASLTELEGLRVSVDRVQYNPAAQATPEKPHAFVYYITIHNESDRQVTIKGRKWVITSTKGEKMVHEGDGVVGEFPCLNPGEQFQYHSYHLVSSDSVAEGAYLGQDSGGVAVLTRIPRFELRIPSLS